MESKEILQQAIDTYGEDAQIDKACEELAELIQALMKYKYMKAYGPKSAVFEEMADVKIMLQQLEMMLDGEPEIQDNYQKKVLRLKERMQ